MSDLVCAKCRRSVPEGAITCVACVLDANDREMRARQLRPLRNLVAVGGEIMVRRTPRTWHVQMYGVVMSFCGEPFAAANRIGFAKLNEIAPGKYCSQCCARLFELVAESSR